MAANSSRKCGVLRAVEPTPRSRAMEAMASGLRSPYPKRNLFVAQMARFADGLRTGRGMRRWETCQATVHLPTPPLRPYGSTHVDITSALAEWFQAPRPPARPPIAE